MVMVVPQARWMVYFMEILLKWMMKWGAIFQETYINLGKLPNPVLPKPGIMVDKGNHPQEGSTLQVSEL